ncbi:hypothetical protein FRC01_004931 [Tulasnella sp. 417]|nr:hypothetical protein FRC01_004931 [Tulasnella sp. 417]
MAPKEWSYYGKKKTFNDLKEAPPLGEAFKSVLSEMLEYIEDVDLLDTALETDEDINMAGPFSPEDDGGYGPMPPDEPPRAHPSKRNALELIEEEDQSRKRIKSFHNYQEEAPPPLPPPAQQQPIGTVFASMRTARVALMDWRKDRRPGADAQVIRAIRQHLMDWMVYNANGYEKELLQEMLTSLQEIQEMEADRRNRGEEIDEYTVVYCRPLADVIGRLLA